MQKFIKQFLIISTILVGFSISAFSKENITLYFDEIAIEDKVNLSIYGSAESEDFSSHKWQIINVKVKDSKNKELLFSTETDKKGFWEVENIDIKDFSDGKLNIEVKMMTEDGEVLASLVDENTIKDTSFKITEFLKNHLSASIFSLMVILLLLGFPMMIPLIAGTSLGVFLLFDGDFSKWNF